MKSTAEKRRVVWAFALAPIPGLLAFVLCLCTLAHIGVFGSKTAGYWECLAGGIALYGIGGSPIAYAAMIVFGLPLYHLFRRQRWLRWWQISLGGMLVGLLAGGALSALTGSWYNVYNAIFAGVGFVSGFFFWKVALCQLRSNKACSRRPSAAADTWR